MESNSTAVAQCCCAASAYVLLFLFCAHRIPQRATIWRGATVAGMIYCAYLVHEYSNELVHSPLLRSTIASFAWIDCLNLSELILVSKIDKSDLTPVAKPNGSGEIAIAGWPAIKLLANWRRIGTKWQVKSTSTRETPSRTRFIVDGCLWVTFCYLVLDLMMQAPVPAASLFAPEKETILYLWTQSAEDIIFRTTTIISFWIMQYLWISKMITFAGLCAVILGINAPADWPDLNGPLSCASTVRDFWGKFWHQCLRQGLTGASTGLCNDVLRIKAPLISRYARLFAAFAFSGAIHQAINQAMGIRNDGFSALKFFLLQPVAISIEDAVQSITKQWHLSATTKAIAGYFWVFFCVCLTTPTWCYPQLRIEEDYSIVPYSIVGHLLRSSSRTG